VRQYGQGEKTGQASGPSESVGEKKTRATIAYRDQRSGSTEAVRTGDDEMIIRISISGTRRRRKYKDGHLVRSPVLTVNNI